MNTGGRLIAGSHNRNEFVLINADENGRVRGSKNPHILILNFFLGFEQVHLLILLISDLGFL